MDKTIAEKLKEWRTARRITQAKAAQILQVKLRTVQDWEQGRSEPRGIGRVALLRALLPQ